MSQTVETMAKQLSERFWKNNTSKIDDTLDNLQFRMVDFPSFEAIVELAFLMGKSTGAKETYKICTNQLEGLSDSVKQLSKVISENAAAA